MPIYRMPHLLKPDADLFREFLAANPDRYTHIDFDIHVGMGRDPGESFTRDIRNMAIHLSQRRIDAVGFRSGIIDIIEITLSAGLKALGQLTAYPTLYQRSFFPIQQLQPVLIAREFSTDAEPLFLQSDIETHILAA